MSYGRQGYDLSRRLSPMGTANENDTQAYIQSVASGYGIPATKVRPDRPGCPRLSV
ncbi:hypothetical protein [Enterobacter phage 02_vB_Eclo_IJM]|nr:hypothetical protein [Enterobacter phage 02_vB_Eclo_IJM]